MLHLEKIENIDSNNENNNLTLPYDPPPSPLNNRLSWYQSPVSVAFYYDYTVEFQATLTRPHVDPCNRITGVVSINRRGLNGLAEIALMRGPSSCPLRWSRISGIALSFRVTGFFESQMVNIDGVWMQLKGTTSTDGSGGILTSFVLGVPYRERECC